jgi:8-oxo-dGTP pyrophosphatase MutT (NUDIX family)
MVFNPAGEVLLILYSVPRDNDGDFTFWITPGGEIEENETPAEAAQREILEEIGLRLDVEGPLYEEENQFLHQGEMRSNRDFFFRTLCPRSAPLLKGHTADEIAVMKEIRWWSAKQIEASQERIFPADLAARIREFASE